MRAGLGLGRKNGWTLAEQAGDVSMDGIPRLLRWADWDVDAVRDDVRDYVVEQRLISVGGSARSGGVGLSGWSGFVGEVAAHCVSHRL